MWSNPAGELTITAEFTYAPGSEENPIKEEYVIVEEVLIIGENNLSLSENAYTTIYEFTPDEIGIYVFEVADDSGAVLGYWGATTNYVRDQTETKTTTLQKGVTDVGQSIMVGVTGSGEVTLTVTKAAEEIEIEPETTYEYYENTHTPSSTYAQLIDADIDAFAYVDITEEYTLAEDSNGIYHLGSVDGPILYVNLRTNVVDLYSAYYDDEGDGGTAIALKGMPVNYGGKDYLEAMQEYVDAAYNHKYYPLTDDLILFMQDYGAAQGWYMAGLSPIDEVNEGTAKSAWMFACCYVETTENEGTEPAAAAVMALAGQRRAGYLL